MKNKFVIGFLVVIAIVIGIYLFMRSNCIKEIVYQPQGEFYYIKGSPISTFGSFDKFKTRNEAVSYCISNKLIQKNNYEK